MEALGVVLLIGILLLVLGCTVAGVYGSAALMRKCLGVNLLFAVIFLMIPPLNIVGILMLAVVGLMVMTGRCSLKESCDKDVDVDD
jgi:hypothetical protein